MTNESDSLIERGEGPVRRLKLAVVIPMYNEVGGAESCVERVLAVMPALAAEATLIVVDDGSRDGTGPLLDELLRTRGGFIVVHQPNAGYGGAVRRGGREAADRGYDYVLFMDSDLTNPPEHIARFIPAMLQGYDVIKGSRFMPGGDMNGVPWNRRIFSVTGNIVARVLFRMGVADCTNGFRAIRTDLFVQLPLTERGFSVIVQELYWAKRRGASVTSVPTSLTARTTDQRTTTFQYRPAVFWSYLKYALRAALVFTPARRPEPRRA